MRRFFTIIAILFAISIAVFAHDDSLFMSTTTQEITIKDNNIDSLTIENNVIDTTLHQSIMFNRDNTRYNLNSNDVFLFKYDSFKEKMKEPWIGDILKEIFLR